MPSLQEVEQFKNILNELGDEPEILAERDEEIEDIPPPERGVPEDLSEMLSVPEGAEAAAEGPGGEMPFPAAPEEQAVDLSDLFGDEDLSGVDVLEGTEPAEGPAGEPAEAAEDTTFDLSDFEFPAEEEPGEGFAEAAEEGVAEAAPGEASEFELPEEFAFPTEEEADAELPAEVPAEEAPAEATAEPTSGEDLPEMPGFDMEGFDADAMPEAEGAEEEAPVEEEAPAEEAGGEAEFELPADFDFGEEAFAEEEAVAPQEPAAEPSDEEAEFLKVLQDQILPEGEGAAEQPPEAAEAVEAAEVPVAEEQEAEAGESFEELGEMLLEAEAAPEAPPEAAPEEAPPAGEIPEEVPLEEGAMGLEGEQIDLEAPAGIPEGAEDYGVDDFSDFSLEGLGEAFGVEEEPEAPPAAEEAPAEIPPVEEQFPEEISIPGTEELTFTDKQFVAIKRTLDHLPRNLKIAIEELIAEKGLEGEDLRSLLALLIEGAAPSEIADQVSRLSGQKIVLPSVFERLTGMAFEEQRRTFGYAFRQNILPILRVVVLSMAVLGLLVFLGYRYVYRPLYANYLYRQGYSQIDKDRYRLANDFFDRAADQWEFRNWYYRYADGFTDRQQYLLAAEKYEQLLESYPQDRRGRLDYASLLTFHLAGYEQADDLLAELLARDMRDYDALLARGDNYLEWAVEDESRYAEARFHYASIIDYYGERDEVLMRMMRYFVRTDKFEETRTLKAYLDDKRSLRVEPQLHAAVYSELAGYWIDKGNYDSVPDMLFKAMEQKPEEPNVHYQLARYYRYIQDQREEVTALSAAIKLLKKRQPLDKRHLFMLIDSYNRRGETFWRRGEYLDAEEHFRMAIERIEDAKDRRIFGEREEFGLAYKNYGDVFYYVSRDLEPALDLYSMALENRYETPDLNYKIGYIHYAADRHEDALLSFAKVVDQEPQNANALYALANSLYQQSYYSSAQGYYLRLLNMLEAREERIPFLQIYDNPEHNALVENIMKVYNNLGVTLKQLSERSRDVEKESKALVNMTFSSERFDLLTRDPVTVVRGETRNLAYLNQRGILYPTSDFQLQIYNRLPIDLEAGRF